MSVQTQKVIEVIAPRLIAKFWVLLGKLHPNAICGLPVVSVFHVAVPPISGMSMCALIPGLLMNCVTLAAKHHD
jgi:hypothetical protein